MLTVEASSFLLAAGVVAGIVGSGGGVTSLVSYPALLAVGVAPLPASIANLVAGVVTGPGSALTSRRELSEAREILVRLMPAATLGTVAGAALLLVTPPQVFSRLVPFLVVAGSLVLVLQPTLLKLSARPGGHGWLPQTMLVGVVSVYGGYFGAGSGVMLLAVILVLVEPRLPITNAIKNVLVGITSIVAAVVFVANGPVSWGAVLPLAGGLLVGSLLGPVVVRRLPANLVRWFAAVCGFALAVYLWARPAA